MKKITVCIILLLCFSSLNAMITEWTGNTDTDWGTATNWTEGVPDASHSAIIPTAVTSGNWPTYSTGSSTCYEVANYGTLYVTGGSLNTNYDFLSGSGSTTSLTGYGGINYGMIEGDFNCNGTVNISDNALISGHEFNSASGSTLNVNGGWLSLDGDFNADGTVNIGDAAVYASNLFAGGTVTQTNGSVNITQNVVNSGTYNFNGGELNASGSFSNESIGIFRPSSGLWAVQNVSNNGTYNQTGGTVSISSSFYNTGTIDQSDGTTSASEDFTNTSTGIFRPAGGLWAVRGLNNNGFFEQTGGEVNVTQNVTNSGTYNQNGGEAEVSGSVTNSGVHNVIYGTLDVTGSYINSATYNQTGGTVTGSNNFNNTGTIDQSDGTTSADGTFTNESIGIFRPSGGLWAVRGLNNQGYFHQTGGQVNVVENVTNNGTIEQDNGTTNVTLDFTNDSPGIFRASTGLWAVRGVNNLGTFEQTGGTVTGSQGMTNSNSYANSGGTLTLTGGYTNTYIGTTTVSSGTLQVGSAGLDGIVNQSGGTVTVDNGFSIEETGFYYQLGGVLNLRGDASFHGPLVNTGTTGEVNFDGGRSQVVTNASTFPVSNMTPSVIVKNGSSVIFDELVSFYCDNLSVQSATLRLNSAYVEEKTPGSGTLYLDGGTLELGGNNNLPDFHNTTFNSASKVTYNSTTHSQEISSDNYGKLEVSGTNKYIENGNVNVGNEFILNSTVVDIRDNDFTIQDGGIFTFYADAFFATTGTGYVKRENISSGLFPIGPDLTNYNGFRFDNNGVALSSIGARVETGIIPTHPNATYCLQRTWDIVKTGTLNADFTFQWLQTQETQPFELARTNSRIVGHLCHTPPSWQVVSTPSGATGSGMLGDPYEYDMGPMVLVSGFCLGDGDHTLPVTLSSFNAIYTNDAGLEFVQVNWSTSTETDVHGFNVYKSETDNFDDAYMINPSLIYGQGTTTNGHSYSFDDLDANIDIRNYYWIEQLDYSGLNELFGPAVYIPEDGGEPGSDQYTETLVLQQYPNPVEYNLNIEYQIKGSADHQDAFIYIYNMKGEFVETVLGHNGSVEIDLSHYATGVYFYILQGTSLGDIYKFVVIH